MDFSGIRVLVTDGGGKQPLAMIRGLKAVNCHITVLCSSQWDSCYVSNIPNKKILEKRLFADSPDAFSQEEKLSFYLSLAKSGDFDVFMPIGEVSTNFVTLFQRELGQYVKLACAPREVYIKAFNKQLTFEQAIKSGIPCPRTRREGQDIEDYLGGIKFPIIIKPRQGLGSIGFHKFNSEKEFRERLKDSAFNIDDYVVQEFVKFDHRIDANIFMDKKGNVCTSYSADVLRWFPVDAGAGVLVQSIDEPEAIKYAGYLLHDMGWQGFANVNFMIDKETGEPKLLEINGRIPASVKLAFMCGFNISQQLLEMVYDEKVTRYPTNDKFGMYIRHFDTDIAWFLKSPDRFRTKPSWFSWKNTQEVLFSKDDKRPFYSNLFQKVFRYNNIMKKKKH
jgi:predicted ATP-grasp superfamily ATP-dependent carboligase